MKPEDTEEYKKQMHKELMELDGNILKLNLSNERHRI